MLSLPPVASISSLDTQNSERLRPQSERQGVNQSQGQEGVRLLTTETARFAPVDQASKAAQTKPSLNRADQPNAPPPPPQNIGFDQILSLQGSASGTGLTVPNPDQDSVENQEISTGIERDLKTKTPPQTAKSGSNGGEAMIESDLAKSVRVEFLLEGAGSVVIRPNAIKPQEMDQGIRAFQQASNQGLQQSFARQSDLKV